MLSRMSIFAGPIVTSVVLLGLVFAWGGFPALYIALLLVALEVTLSFDNAVVNARVLMRMNEVWRKRFLTWGIFIAVFGTRFVLPILIVSASVFLSPVTVFKLALFDAPAYSALLLNAKHAIGAFGGMFLLMVSLKYFFDAAKEVHWIHVVERHLARWGRIEAVEIVVALTALVLVAQAVHGGEGTVLVAGIVGIVLFIVMQGITSAFSVEAEEETDTAPSHRNSVALFMYLEVLDAAFSLDGVVGAFAITRDLPVIVAGLCIGAYFVRSLTVYLVRRRSLESLVYLEHGAHWAIFGLAMSMLLGLVWHVPELITAFIGFVFVAAAYRSSVRVRAS